MNDQKGLTTDDSSRKPSRREVLAGTGAVGLMLMNASSVFAQGADGANTIRVGFISPRTDPAREFWRDRCVCARSAMFFRTSYAKTA